MKKRYDTSLIRTKQMYELNDEKILDTGICFLWRLRCVAILCFAVQKASAV